MSITNYTDLQTSIAGWLKRSNLTDRIPDFIALAEAQLNRDLRSRQMAATYSRTTDQNIISLPDDYLAAEKLELDGRTLDYIDRYAADSGQLSNATNNRYTVIGNAVWLLTQVAKPSVFTLYYYQRITPLSASEPQNWLIEDAPDAYLYGSLLQAEPYLKNDQRIAIWGSKYQSVIDTMNATNATARTSGSALRMRSA